MRSNFFFAIVLVGLVLAYPVTSTASIPFGAALSYSVVASSLVSNAGQAGTVINGNIAAATVTGFVGIDTGSGICNGNIQVSNAISQGALAAGAIAYHTALNVSCNNNTVPQELGGKTLTPGIYCNSLSASQITGDLTLSGPAGSIWIFQLPGAFTAESASQIIFSGGANACGVFWVVVSAAIKSTSAFQGNVLASAQIAVLSSATVQGRLISVLAGVSFIGNVVTLSPCNNTTPIPTSSSSTGGAAVSSSSTGGAAVSSSSSAGASTGEQVSSSTAARVSSSTAAAVSSSTAAGISSSTGASGASLVAPSIALVAVLITGFVVTL